RLRCFEFLGSGLEGKPAVQIYANSNQGDGKRKAPKVDEGHSARKSVLQLPTGPAPALSAMLLITKLEAFNCRWRQQPSSATRCSSKCLELTSPRREPSSSSRAAISVLDASSPLPSGIISSRVWFRRK